MKQELEMVRSPALFACSLVLIHAAACGGSRTETDAGASKPPTSSQGSTASGPCDDYIRIVTQCIETKMPEPDRTNERQNIEIFRKMLRSDVAPRAEVDKQCVGNLRRELRRDIYGCYAEEAAKRGVQTACTLLSRAELEAIMEAPLEDGVPGNGDCRFAFAREPLREPFKIAVHWEGGRDEMDAARGGQAIVNGRLAKDTGQSDLVPGATIEGVGDDAFFIVAGVWPMLKARLGEVAVDVQGADRDRLIAIARKALPRIHPEPPNES